MDKAHSFGQTEKCTQENFRRIKDTDRVGSPGKMEESMMANGSLVNSMDAVCIKILKVLLNKVFGRMAVE